MKLLERLKKTIGIDLSKLTSLVRLNINVNIDRSVHIDAKGSSVDINPAKLNGKQRRNLQAILRESLEEAGVLLVSDKAETVDAVRADMSAIQSEIGQLQRIVPPEDIPLLHASLYLRYRHRAGGAIEDLKMQIARVYGQRGRNFANLCSAGYLEDWFLPLHQELTRKHSDDPAAAKAKFLSIYALVVNELPWTVFICARISKKKAAADIARKVRQNAQNGIRFFNLHALGESNTKKIIAMLPDIQKMTGSVVAHMEQEPARIFVRLEVPAP
jgi:hypothetical protein